MYVKQKWKCKEQGFNRPDEPQFKIRLPLHLVIIKIIKETAVCYEYFQAEIKDTRNCIYNCWTGCTKQPTARPAFHQMFKETAISFEYLSRSVNARTVI